MKKIKKVLSVILILTVLFSTIQSSLVFANDEVAEVKNEVKDEEATKEIVNFNATGITADIEAPVLDVSSLAISKNEVKPGESVRVSLKATDDMSGMKSITIYYETPITKKTESLYMNYNSSLDIYEYELQVDENKEDGIWKIYSISAYDNSQNNIYIYNSDLSNYGNVREDLSKGNFKVSGTNADIKSPVIDVNSLEISKNEVKPGESVRVSLKATDDMSGIRSITIYYETPITKKQNLYI